ncbi:hypothetical protein JCM24511_07148 [Saitozyma sp. JCM 24511]|nr:hypothetical protein JCM24511_07148 [Saitozyma sp. JCM 24511]
MLIRILLPSLSKRFCCFPSPPSSPEVKTPPTIWVEVMTTIAPSHLPYPISPTSTKNMFSEPMTTTPESEVPPTTDMATPTSPPSAHLLRRVLSQGSNSSTSASATATTAIATPKTGSTPLSPGSGGARTPKARKAVLRSDGDVAMAGAGGGEGKKDGEELASDLDQLKVRSPIHDGAPNPIQSRARVGTAQVANDRPPTTNHSTHDRSYSTSTEGSSNSAGHPHPPSQLGSMYGPEGFAAGGAPVNGSGDIHMKAQVAAAVAAADEAVMQLNGTSTIYHGPVPPGMTGPDGVYQLPRGYSGFAKPQAAEMRTPGDHNVSRQSSTSSTTTEASTSSEESDLCIPTLEWVDRSDVPPQRYGWGTSPYLPQSPGRAGARASPARMPPPATTGRGGVTSPKRGQANGGGDVAHPQLLHQASLPLGATAHTPTGLRQSSALPPGIDGEAPAEEEDDEQTVGHGRDRTASTSSESSHSGLDLLWRAVSHNGGGPPERHASPYGEAYDGKTKGKRKAGADAVAQWRTSGIPSGMKSSNRSNGSMRRDGSHQGSAPGDGGADAGSGGAGGPPKKRRRSELKLEQVDPALLESPDRGETESAMDQDGSDFQSTSDEPVSGDDSEYGAGRGRKPAGGTAARGRGVAARKAGTKSRQASGGTAPKPAPPPKKSKKTESPSGAAKGGRRTSGPAIPAGGVQCEYVNPLPPYNRCQDVFTRKYDVPRHMARHARREGELVADGKLSEEKAILWRTIKDKPKVTCNQCGESFTRMDALKRHQAKQHHHQ